MLNFQFKNPISRRDRANYLIYYTVKNPSPAGRGAGVRAGERGRRAGQG